MFDRGVKKPKRSLKVVDQLKPEKTKQAENKVIEIVLVCLLTVMASDHFVCVQEKTPRPAVSSVLVVTSFPVGPLSHYLSTLGIEPRDTIIVVDKSYALLRMCCLVRIDHIGNYLMAAHLSIETLPPCHVPTAS